jgi:hypothetical protein
MSLQIETQPFQFNTSVTGLDGAVFNSVSAVSLSGTFYGNGGNISGVITAVSGTNNQINASKSGSTVTLSLPNSAVFPGNVTVLGNLSAQGTATFANTVFTTTSALSAVANSSGPALYIGQSGSGDLASFYDLSPTPVEVLHVGASVGIPGVGIYTSTPNKELTVVGEISATKTIYASGGNSDQWNSTYTIATSYQNASGSFATNTLLQSTSALLTPLTTTNTLTGSLYSTIQSTSALLTPLTITNTLTSQLVLNTTLNSLSGNWQNTYTTVSANSATTWNYQGTDLKNLSSGWVGGNNAYTWVNSNSAIATFTTSVSAPALSGVHYGDGSKLTGIVTGNLNLYLPLSGGVLTGALTTTSTVYASAAQIGSTASIAALNVSPLTITAAASGSVFNQIQNTTPGVSASTDVSLYNDLGTIYLDMGINSSAYNGNVYGPVFNIVGPNDSYFFTTSANLAHGNTGSTGDLIFFTGGSLSGTSVNSGNERIRIKNTNTANVGGFVGVNTSNPNQQLTVSGNISGTGNIVIGGLNTAAVTSSVLGGRCNTASGVYSTVVGGFSGGATGYATFVGAGSGNCATCDYAVVVGGSLNRALTAGSFIGSGTSNLVSGACSIVIGGLTNCAIGVFTFVGGGTVNCATCGMATVVGGKGNTATNNCSFIGGGCGNNNGGVYGVIVGGNQSTIGGQNNQGFIGNGINNLICDNANCSSIINGNANKTPTNAYAFIGGGTTNTASGLYSSILNGKNNISSGTHSFIAGGSANDTKGFQNTFILGTSLSAVSANYAYFNNVEIANTPSSLIMKDTSGKRWTITVSTGGALVVAAA